MFQKNCKSKSVCVVFFLCLLLNIMAGFRSVKKAVAFLSLKFRFCKKATKFEKTSHLFLKLPNNVKVGYFFEFLWPSQNIGTVGISFKAKFIFMLLNVYKCVRLCIGPSSIYNSDRYYARIHILVYTFIKLELNDKLGFQHHDKICLVKCGLWRGGWKETGFSPITCLLCVTFLSLPKTFLLKVI